MVGKFAHFLDSFGQIEWVLGSKEQGDQVGRIFAHRPTAYFGQFEKLRN
jgi:hypothetical protein